jgi:Fe-S-cluster containining protein
MNGDMLNNKLISNNGTFSFCNGCPSNKNCCTGRSVDKALLTPQDISNISKKTGLHRSKYSLPSEGFLSEMKVSQNTCYFYQNSNCIIYDVRPIDCRIFPFDIRKDTKQKLILIWYLTACPKKINASFYEKKIEPLIRQISPYFEEFAEYRSPLLDKHKYLVVKTL